MSGLTSPGGGSSVTLPIAESDVTNLVADLALKAPLASPTLTGTVVIPAAAGATSPYQKGEVDTLLALKAPLASPTLTGTVVIPAAAGSTSPYQKGEVDTLLAAKSPLASVIDTWNANPEWATANNNGVVPGTALKFNCYPIRPPGGGSRNTINAAACRVNTGLAASTYGIGIYSIAYSAQDTLTATLLAKTTAVSSAASGVIPTDLNGAVTFDWATTQYVVAVMASTNATLAMAGITPGTSAANLGYFQYSGTARSDAQDFPSSFTQADVASAGSGERAFFVQFYTTVGKRVF